MPDLELPILRAAAFVLVLVLFLWAQDKTRSLREIDRCDRRERELMNRLQRMQDVNNAMSAHSFENQRRMETFEHEIASLRKAVITLVKEGRR